MKRENRVAERFEEMGRVSASQICALPGVLDDISSSGCKVHFPNPVNLDLENDYKICVDFANSSLGTLNLVVHPMWHSEDSSETAIGFKILYSPDTPKLKAGIDFLKVQGKKSENDGDIKNLIIAPSANIIQ